MAAENQQFSKIIENIYIQNRDSTRLTIISVFLGAFLGTWISLSYENILGKYIIPFVTIEFKMAVIKLSIIIFLMTILRIICYLIFNILPIEIDRRVILLAIIIFLSSILFTCSFFLIQKINLTVKNIDQISIIVNVFINFLYIGIIIFFTILTMFYNFLEDKTPPLYSAGIVILLSLINFYRIVEIQGNTTFRDLSWSFTPIFILVLNKIFHSFFFKSKLILITDAN